MQLIVRGLASKKIYKILKVQEVDHDMKLLDFLNLNLVPVASSCDGDGVCKQCITSNKRLTCAISVLAYIKTYGDEVSFSYL